MEAEGGRREAGASRGSGVGGREPDEGATPAEDASPRVFSSNGYKEENHPWRERFTAALQQAVRRAETAERNGHSIACGFTANLDRVAALDQPLLERLFAGHRSDGRRSRVARADSVDDLLVAIAQCVAAGEGCDLPVRDAAVRDWLLRQIGGRVQIGGTGAQAAATLARLGFPALLHLTGRAPEQIAAFPVRERIRIASPAGLLPIDAAGDAGDLVMWHAVLEFAAGVRAPLPEAPAAPAPNRVIVTYDPVNAAFGIDPGFAAALADPRIAIDALLVSGFSQLDDFAARERVLGLAAEAIRGWRATRPDLLVHLELGAMPEPASVMRILDVLHPVVTSIGINSDEVRELLAGFGIIAETPGPGLVAQLRWLQARYPTPRFSLHARDFCLTLTENDPEAERSALLFGTLVAATRSSIGGFPEIADVRKTLANSEVNREGMAVLDSLGVAAEGYAANGVVVTPGLRIASPVATVGLGDSFTAGVLAMLGPIPSESSANHKVFATGGG